jgi:Na+/H+ antiporter NhaD/arsenite permease-like protein
MSNALIATVIFIAVLVLLLSDRMDRTIVALVGASLMIGLGSFLGFYDEHLAIEAVDFETLVLLFGMMVLVALLRPTGVFEYLAINAARLSRGRPVVLLILLGIAATLLSMLLDNVTTIILLAPLAILITQILGISPLPYLIGLAMLSNTGGVGTLIGDPPNIIIGSAASLTFNDFLIYSLPVVIVAWIAALGVILWQSRRELSVLPEDPTVLEGLSPTEALHDVPTARKVGVILALTVLLFFLQGVLGLSTAFIAFSMASLALLWLRPPIEEVLEHVEWSVLLFFIGLFVMVGGLEASGALKSIETLLLEAGQGRAAQTALLVVWLSAAGSALVDNIPITVTMVPVIQDLGRQGLEIFPLWWALAFGAGFGGNATIIAATTNVVAVQYSKKTKAPIDSRMWLRRGVPVALVTCLIASLAFILFLPYFSP